MARAEIPGSTGTASSGTLRFALALIAVLMAAFALPALASADDRGPDFGQFLTIKFVDGTTSQQRLTARKSVGAAYQGSLAAPSLQQASVPADKSSAAAADTLESNPVVDFAVASGTWSADALPDPYFNDSFYGKQWALNNTGQVFMSRLVDGQFNNISGTPGADINAPEAWEQFTPSERQGHETIAVVDTGVAYEHPDLEANMVAGHDFYDADSDPRDINGHGTHVASVVASVADNGIGTVGVDPWAKVMPLRAADQYGSFSWAAIAAAVSDGLDKGVRVFNGSFGGPDYDPAFEEIMRSNPSALFIFSAGNGGADQLGDNHDSPNGLAHRYPCDSELPNVICVGASNWLDALSSFSDYGVNSVDLLAPGSSIYAAEPCLVPATSEDHQTECPYDGEDETAPVGLGGGPSAFQLLSGTSMSAPAVSATAGLLWSKCPGLRSSQVKRAIVTTVDPIAAVKSKVAYGGRLNVGSAVSSLGGACPAASDGSDWPTPPVQPSGPGGDGGPAGGSDGGGTIAPPVVDIPRPPAGTTSAKPLRFRIIRPRKSKVGHTRKVKFKLKCSATCSAKVVVRPIASGVKFKSFKHRLKRGRSGTRTVKLKIPHTTLRAVRALLSGHHKVRLRYSVVVTDKAGLSSKPTRFSVTLSR